MYKQNGSVKILYSSEYYTCRGHGSVCMSTVYILSATYLLYAMLCVSMSVINIHLIYTYVSMRPYKHIKNSCS